MNTFHKDIKSVLDETFCKNCLFENKIKVTIQERYLQIKPNNGGSLMHHFNK
jgi:hypothetical protein